MPRRRRTRQSLVDLLPIANTVFVVCSFLDLPSLLSLSCSCKSILEMCCSDVVWDGVWRRESSSKLPEKNKRLGQSTKQVRHTLPSAHQIPQKPVLVSDNSL